MSISLFTIQCETCTARLKVRDPSTIGQILACPKCESMVQIIPPPGWQGLAANSPPTSSSPLQKTPAKTIKTPAKKTAQQLPTRQEMSKKKPTADEPAADAGSRRRSALGRSALPQRSVDPQARSQEQDKEVSAAGQPAGQEPTPPSQTRRVSDGSKKQPLPLSPSSKQQAKREEVAAAAASVALTPPPIEPASAAVTAVTGTVPAATPAAASADSLPPGGGWVSPTEKLVRQWLLVGGLLVGGGVIAGSLITWAFVDNNKVATEELSGAVTSKNNNDKAQTPEPGGKDHQPKGPSTATGTVSTDSPNSANARADHQPPSKTPEPDPLPKDPPSQSAAAAPPTDTPSEDDNDATAAAESTDPPKDAGPLEEDVDIPVSILPDLDDPGANDDAATRRKNRRKPLEVVDIQSRLADPIAQIEFRKVALWRYLDFISGLSTIPITFDTDALGQRGISASEPVSVKLDDTTIEAAIESVLKRLKLELEIERGHLLVTTPRDGTSAMLQQSFAVGDLTTGGLAGDDSDALDELARLVPRLVAPAEWQTDGGRIRSQDGQLLVSQTSQVMWQVDTFLKRLRSARGKSEKSGPTSDRQTLTSRYGQARHWLSQTIAASYVVPTPLAEIIGRLRKQTKLVVLVDWQSLSAIRIGPMTAARMSARGKSLESALGALLTPLDLTFRIVDSRTIEITSMLQDAARREIEFHTLRDLAGGIDQARRLIGQIRKDLGPDPAATLHYDPASRCLIVSAGARLQIEIEKRLDIERAKAGEK